MARLRVGSAPPCRWNGIARNAFREHRPTLDIRRHLRRARRNGQHIKTGGKASAERLHHDTFPAGWRSRDRLAQKTEPHSAASSSISARRQGLGKQRGERAAGVMLLMCASNLVDHLRRVPEGQEMVFDDADQRTTSLPIVQRFDEEAVANPLPEQPCYPALRAGWRQLYRSRLQRRSATLIFRSSV